MTEDSKLLQRYVDGDLSPAEVEAFQVRLAESPELERELSELLALGGILRAWAARTEARADGLLAPTLSRIGEADQQRARQTSLGFLAAALLLFASPWTRDIAPPFAGGGALPRTSLLRGANIERLEAGSTQARVFVVGSAGTPVVWLADDAAGDADPESQGPG